MSFCTAARLLYTGLTDIYSVPLFLKRRRDRTLDGACGAAAYLCGGGAAGTAAHAMTSGRSRAIGLGRVVVSGNRGADYFRGYKLNGKYNKTTMQPSCTAPLTGTPGHDVRMVTWRVYSTRRRLSRVAHHVPSAGQRPRPASEEGAAHARSKAYRR